MVEAAFLICTFIRMRSEVITLCLYQIGTNMPGMKGIQVADGICHCRYGKSAQDCLRRDLTKIFFIGNHTLLEELIQQQMGSLRILFICSGDFVEEFCLNNTAGTEDGRNIS